LRATKDNITYFESQRKVLEAQNLERRSEAEAAGGKMKDLKVTLIRQASEALQLYGSVTSRDISDAAISAGVKIEPGQAQLAKPAAEGETAEAPAGEEAKAEDEAKAEEEK